ncbi:hypothetical protein ES150_02280 [Enterobacillus tribolii]|nr:hypothetical protein [Enterobacillus tribolii]
MSASAGETANEKQLLVMVSVSPRTAKFCRIHSPDLQQELESGVCLWYKARRGFYSVLYVSSGMMIP